MRNANRNAFALLLLGCAACLTSLGEAEEVVLQIPFELQEDLAGLGDTARIEAQAGHDGHACAVVDCASPGSVSLERFPQLPPAHPPRARLLQFSFPVRCSNDAEGQVTVSLLKQFQDPDRENGPNEWFDYLKPVFLTAPLKPQWSQISGEGLVGPDVKGVGLYIRVSVASGEGRIWLDDVRVRLLDRGLLLGSGRKGNVFAEDAGQMSLTVSDPQRLQSGQVVLTDEMGQRLSETPIAPGQGDVAIPLPTRGYYDLQAEATYTDGVTVAARTQAAVVGPLIPDELRLRSPFGMSGHGPLFLAAGARWDRRFRNLARFEAARASGYAPGLPVPLSGPVVRDPTSIYVFWPQPPWLQDGKDAKSGEHNPFEMHPITDREEFARLVQYVAAQTPQRIQYLEVANEPESWHGPWEGLVDYHALMGQAVKAVSPETRIVGPCLCTIKIHELKHLVDLGLLKHIDALSIHAYVTSTPPEREFIDYIRQLRAYMASIGREDMEILITEFGWPIPPGDWQKPVDPLTQARYCSRSLVLMRAEELTAVQWFCLRWADPNASAASYGLVDFEWLPRPSYAAYANVTRCLAGTTGPGRVVHLSPTTYLTSFANDRGGCVVAAWNTEGVSRAFIPSPRTYLRDMVGRPLTASPGVDVAVSPSPVFAVLPDASFAVARVHDAVRVVPGGSAAVTFPAVWVPPQLSYEDGRLAAAAEAPAGPHSLIGRSPEGGWLLLPVDVVTPLSVVRQSIVWPVAQESPSFRVSLRPALETPADAQAHLRLDGLPESRADVHLAPGQTVDLDLPLAGLVPGARYLGHLDVQANGQTDEPMLRCPVDITVLPCATRDGGSPTIDISAWDASRGLANRPRQPAPEDLSATLEATYSDQGMGFLIVVRDNTHQQSESRKAMWENDSVQLAFDLDAERPWSAEAQGGFGGHVRVYEYGAALGEAGSMTWRWLSADPQLPPDVEDGRVVAHVQREGDRTAYRLFFPWETLGGGTAPTAGTSIGFALLVNDSDAPAGPRGTLALFGGIADRKDPTAFGRLFLR